MGLEERMEHMLWLGESVISKNETKTIQDVITEFDKIKRDDIKRVAGEILNPERFNLSVVGPLSSRQEKEMNHLINA